MADDDEALAELESPIYGAVPDDIDEPAAIPLLTESKFRIPKGKYKGLELPRMIGLKPKYLEKVEALKAEIIADPEFQRHASSIATTYAEIRREAEAKAEELSEIKLRLAATMLLMIDQYEVEGTTAMTLDNGDSIRVQPEPHLIVLDKEAFRQWCLKEGLDTLMVLPWGTANKLVKDRLLEGNPEPPGAQAFMRPKVVFSKGTK